MPARKYSDALLTEAAQLREAGLPIREIAGRLGMHPSAVSWHCLRLGADHPDAARRAHSCRQPMMEYTRNGRVVRRFTPEEDEQLLQLEAEGLSAGDIAQHMNRRRNSIVGRLMTLARQETRNEARAARLQNDKVRVAGARPHDLFPAQPVPPSQKGQMQ